jgi:hypothetical protein
VTFEPDAITTGTFIMLIKVVVRFLSVLPVKVGIRKKENRLRS